MGLCLIMDLDSCSCAPSLSPWFNMPTNSKNGTKKCHITKMYHTLDLSKCLQLKLYFLPIFRKMSQAAGTLDQKVQCPVLSGLIWSPKMISFIICVCIRSIQKLRSANRFFVEQHLSAESLPGTECLLYLWVCSLELQNKLKRKNPIEQRHSCYIYTHLITKSSSHWLWTMQVGHVKANKSINKCYQGN